MYDIYTRPKSILEFNDEEVDKIVESKKVK